MSPDIVEKQIMTVTRIEELSKSRSRVYIDDQFAFVLYKGELRLYHLREGEEIALQDYETILGEILPKRAKLRAMNLLKSRDYTVSQLRQKLEQGGYPEAVAEEALGYVESFHYTDDLRYAVSFIAGHENSRSRRRIEQDLMRRGICREPLEKAWLEWEEQGGRQDEHAIIRELLRKKKFDPECADEKEKLRIYAFLLRKGFSGELARKAVNGIMFCDSSEDIQSYT